MFVQIGMQTLQIDYGSRLIALRKEKHWSRERLAQALNVSYFTIRRMESNETLLTLGYAEAIAVAYGLHLIEFWKWMCE